MKTYRGFLFDADNTLFDYDRAEAESLDETLEEAAPSVPREQARAAYRVINDGYWRRFEQGTVSLPALKVGRFEDLMRRLGVPGEARAVAEHYLARLGSKAYFLPHAPEVVRELSRSAPLALVTNGISAVQRGRLKLSGIASCFTAVLISEELGVAKPDRRFFQAALDAIGLSPRELLCVGDNPDSDIAGAQAAGIDAAWYAPTDAAWPRPAAGPAFVIRDLRELLRFAPTVFPGD
jgi:2-haloacid dehalogenase